MRGLINKNLRNAFLIVLIAFPLMANEGSASDYLQGKADASIDAKSNPLWVLAGLSGTGFCLLFGIAGIGLAAVMPPSPPSENLMGRSQMYITGYTEEYRRKGRWGNVKYATIGCGMAAVINLLINLIFFPEVFNQYSY